MVNSIATEAVAIKKKVAHNKLFESHLLLNSPIMSSLADIRIIRNRSGTAATPLRTAVYTRAFTGLMPIKFIQRPIRVEMIITI
jgi:hypothetical protein